VASKLQQENRAEFKRYKEDVRKEGKPFFPYAIWHDTVMSLVVVAVIIGLAILWKTTSDGTDAGTLGPLYADKADPGTVNFVPRPDWYFYFLFYLLRIFKWPESVILGTVGLPTIALLLLLALPFIDLRSERRPLRRPVAIVGAILVVLSLGILTYRGAVAKESLGVENLTHVSEWAKKEGFANNKEALAGAKLFAVVGCLNCHTYNGTGSHNLGAPDLTAEGSKHKGIAFQIAHLKCPGCVNPGSPMPSFASQGPKNLQELATFLEASKGGK
jgi:menaquinol-cytochrome c reductase cytochrome b/c subunit